MILTSIILLILFCIFIVQEVQIDKIKTGDYLLWYTFRNKRYCINVSDKIRDIFLN